MTTSALILETNNLAGGDATIVPSLARLLERLREQTRPLTSLSELVITHDGLTARDRLHLETVAGRAIEWVELPSDVTYYEAKNAGFDASTAELVVFADADCWPDSGWLAALLDSFEDPAVRVAAGRTTYRRDLLGVAASTIDFMYFGNPAGTNCTRNFYANNVAFRRDVFAAHRYGEHQMYRGHCVVLGLRLREAGVPIRFVPGARTIHRFPDRLAELARLRLLRGEDLCEVAPHLRRSYLPKVLHRLPLGPALPLGILAARFGFSVAALGRQDMPPVRGLRRLAAVGLIAGISLLDVAGATGRAFGVTKNDDRVSVSLSYHGDDDRLAA
jgi:hypothetical protein